MKSKKDLSADDLQPESRLLIPANEDEHWIFSTREGRDEMNLAEFPFASLRRRGDSRKAITYEGWVSDKAGNRLRQKWMVRGDSLLGLPTEFDERVYVALMAIAARRGFESRKLPFSTYEVLKIMGEDTNKAHYQVVENSLDRLKGVTIKAEGAFWDNEESDVVRTVLSFGLVDEYWLRYRETNAQVRQRENVPAYILWNERIWKSIQAGYLKSLDIGFYYSLKSPAARRLYRLLDKRMWDRGTYEFDVFDLSGKLGMVRYRKPSDVITKLKPALDELVDRGFLESADPILANGYRRLRFTKAAHVPTPTLAERWDAALPEPATDRSLLLPEPESEAVFAPLAALSALGMANRTAQALVGAYPAERIQEWIEAATWERAQGKPIKNMAAYVRRALEDGWQLPTGFLTRSQRLAEATARERQMQDYAQVLAAQQAADEQSRQFEEAQRAEFAMLLNSLYGTTAEHFELWAQVLEDVQTQVDFSTYWQLFATSQLINLSDGTATVGVRSEEQAFYLSRQTRLDLFRRVLKGLGHDVQTLVFTVLPAQN